MLIAHEDLSSSVYRKLKDMILKNELKAGEQLKQEQIATLFGVSRMPLHKAFQMLENEFLVENRPRKGFFVTQVDPQRLIDAFEVREAVEGIAARRAAKVITKEEVDYLKSLFAPFEETEKIDIQAYGRADQLFHDFILKVCGNQILDRLEVISNVTLQTYTGGLIRGPEETLPEHWALINALEEGNATKAEKLARAHSRKTCKLLLKSLR
jgi:DNA-binding GntR family transcriptional regulator